MSKTGKKYCTENIEVRDKLNSVTPKLKFIFRPHRVLEEKH